MNDLNILAVAILFDDGMGHEEQEMPFHQPQCLPPLFTALDSILIAKREGVCKGPSSRLETDAMLSQVALGFGRLPGKAYGWHDRNIIIILSLCKEGPIGHLGCGGRDRCAPRRGRGCKFERYRDRHDQRMLYAMI